MLRGVWLPPAESGNGPRCRPAGLKGQRGITALSISSLPIPRHRRRDPSLDGLARSQILYGREPPFEAQRKAGPYRQRTEGAGRQRNVV
jgi:hypothetical protein